MLNKPTQEKDALRADIQRMTEEFLQKGGKIDVPHGFAEHKSNCTRCNRSLFGLLVRKSGKVFCCQRCADLHVAQ
jgi:hypothetical protein